MKRSRENGSILEVLVIGIFIVVAMALIAWRYIEADKAQNDTELALANQSISAPPNNTLPLLTLGVKIKVTAVMTQTYGTLAATKTDDGYEIRSLKLNRKGWNCKGNPNQSLLGTIKKSDDKKSDIEVNGQALSFTPNPDVSCYADGGGNDLIKWFQSDLKSVIVPLG